MAHVPSSYIKNKKIDYDEEIFAVMSLPVRFAGVPVRPPSIGVFSLLEIIDSVFIKDPSAATMMDFHRALYIAFHGEACVLEIREWVAAGGRESFDLDKRSTWLPWDFEVATFAIDHPATFADFAAFNVFLTEPTFSGYEMIPSMGASSSAYLFGADSIAGVFRIAGKATGMGYREIIWELPLALVGHLAAIEAKANGVQGVGRPKDPDDIKKQIADADIRESRGELHPWQIEEPHMYPLEPLQVKARPEIKKDFNVAMKNYLRKQREREAAKIAENKSEDL